MTDTNGDGQFLRNDLVKVKKPIFGNITYDVLSDIVNLGFPGAAALYATIAIIWGLPFSEEIVATVAAVVVFLGILLKISSNRWNNRPYDGEFVANDPDPDANTYRAIFDKGLPTLGAQDEVRLKVVDLSRQGDSQ